MNRQIKMEEIRRKQSIGVSYSKTTEDLKFKYRNEISDMEYLEEVAQAIYNVNRLILIPEKCSYDGRNIYVLKSESYLFGKGLPYCPEVDLNNPETVKCLRVMENLNGKIDTIAIYMMAMTLLTGFINEINQAIISRIEILGGCYDGRFREDQ